MFGRTQREGVLGYTLLKRSAKQPRLVREARAVG